MFRPTDVWQDFDRRRLAEKIPLEKALAIVDSLVEHARDVGVWPSDDPLEGIETDIELARVLNSCSLSC